MTLKLRDDLIMPVNHFHLGSGDNVARDKHSHHYVNTLLDAKGVSTIVDSALLALAIKGYKEARNEIEPYLKLNILSIEAVNMLNILLLFIDSIESGKPMATDLLRYELRDRNLVFYELYQALLVRTLAKNSIQEANKAYTKFSESAEYHLLAVYDHLFATKKELLTRFDNEVDVLDDYSLFYLAHGLFRVESHKQSSLVFNKISTKNQSENIKYWIIAAELNSIIFSQEGPFSYIHRDVSRKIEALSSRFLELISNKDSLDPLSTNILISLINLTRSTLHLPEINNIGLRFRKDVSKSDKELGRILDQIAENKSFLVPDWVAYKLEADRTFDEKEVEYLIQALVQKSIDLKLFKQWSRQSEMIIESKVLSANTLKVFLLSFNNFENDIEKNEYRVLLNEFLNQYSSQLTDVSPIIIKYWCNNIFNLGTTFEVVIYKILSSVCKDLNVNSDLNLYYLQSLLHLDKIETLGQELAKVEDHEWNHDLFLFQARYYLRVENYKQAQITYNKFIDKEKSLYVWHEYLVSCMEGEKDTTLAKEQLPRIPDNLLSKNDAGFHYFLFQVGQFIDFNFVERIIVRLFIDNPYENAPIVVRIYLNSFHHQNDNLLDEDKNFSGTYYGAVYEVDGKQHQQLIVDHDLAKHRELLSIQSAPGQLLSNICENEQVSSSFGKVTLLGRQSVSNTVFQLAMQIVSESQYSYPQPLFYEVELRLEGCNKDIAEYIQKAKLENPIRDKVESFLRESNLPLYVKGRKVSESRMINEELDVVYSLLLNTYSNQCLDQTYQGIKETDALVIDIYGAVYLCMTNLYKSIISLNILIFISYETEKAVRLWIDNVTRDDFLRLDEHQGSLSKIDSNTMRKIHGNLIDALDELISYATIGSVKKFDLPTTVSEMKSLLSPSVFSSIKLSLSQGIPWLCLDSVIGQFIIKDTECRLVSFHHLVEKLISDNCLTFNDRKKALEYYAHYGLYTQYYFSDLVELSKAIEDLPTLTRLLNNRIMEFTSPLVAVSILTQLVENIIPIGFKKKVINNRVNGRVYLHASIRNYMYDIQGSYAQELVLENTLYACFSKAIRAIEKPTVEERLAYFIIGFRTICKVDQYLDYFHYALSGFTSGHFLKEEDIVRSIKMLLENGQEETIPNSV